MLLFEARPELEQEWDFEKNSGMDPYKLSYGYYKMVHWKCQHGHTWEASISTRANGGGNCPACPGKRQQFVSGINDLATLYPDLMEEWDWEENAGLDPTQISPGCNKTVKWKCKKYGHSWSTTITARTKMKCGRPYCANQKVLSGFNDLATLYPDLAAQWNYDKNDVTPSDIIATTCKPYFWVCNKGHTWPATPASRITYGYGCQYCSGHFPIVGENDLATLYPDLVKEWDYEENVPLTPEQCMANTNKKVAWICPKGHHYTMNIGKRTQRGDGCPYCSGRYPIIGETDLATTNPEILAEWDHEANYPLTPQQVKAGSGTEVYWKCSKGHIWKASPANRLNKIHSRGCPKCAHIILEPGETDLATVYPELVKEWDWEKNEVQLNEVFARSAKVTIHWKCEKGHTWSSTPDARISTGCRIMPCPQCPRNISGEEQEVFDYVQTLLPNEMLIQSDRKILHGKELDIYIPNLNIAIEYNGLFWHSEFNGKGETYHLNKFLECQRQGILLLTVWENHWLNHADIVQERLCEALHTNNPTTIPLDLHDLHLVTDLSSQDTRHFFSQHHLNGCRKSTNCVTLVDENNDIISALSFTIGKRSARIVQYASTRYIPEGFTTLLRAVVDYCSTIPSCTKLVATSDNDWPYDHILSSASFRKDKMTPPKQKFFCGNQVRHSSGFSR